METVLKPSWYQRPLQQKQPLMRNSIHANHRRNFRGYDGYAYPHFLKWGYRTPTFKRYKRPSFEQKLRRNAWAAGAYSTPPDSLARLRALILKGRESRGGKVEGETEGKRKRWGGKKMGRGGWKWGKMEGRGSGTPTFSEEVTPLPDQVFLKWKPTKITKEI